MRDLKLPQQRHPEKAHRPDNAQPKKPDWIRVKAPTSEGYKKTRDILREKKLVTVCEEAGCPNVGECWSVGHATMMIMGDICTRGCSLPRANPPVWIRLNPGAWPMPWRNWVWRMWLSPRLTAMIWPMAGPRILPKPSAPFATAAPIPPSKF